MTCPIIVSYMTIGYRARLSLYFSWAVLC